MLRAFFLLSLFAAAPVFGQSYYFNATSWPHAWPEQDVKFSVIIAVGTSSGGNFIPDSKKHTFTYLRTDPIDGSDTSVFRILSPTVGSFSGFDTLTFNFHASVSSEAWGVFEFDGQHIDSTSLTGDEITSFHRLSISPSTSNLKIGSKPIVPIYISSSNLLPVTIQTISFSGDTDIQFIDSSVHTPWEILNATNTSQSNFFLLHVAPHANDSLTTSCSITVITEWGNNSLDTELYNFTFHFVVPNPGECLQTPYDIEFNGVTPFGYSATQTIPVYNPQPVPITISSATLDTYNLNQWKQYLSFDTSQFPVTIKPHDSDFVQVTLAVPADSFEKIGQFTSVYFNLISNDSDGVLCPYSQMEINVRAARFWKYDTVSIPMFAPSIIPIQFFFGEAGGPPEAMFVRFINNDSAPVRPVSWLYAPDTLEYKTLLWQYSSDTALQPNGSFIACLAWLNYTGGADNGEFIVMPMEDGTSSRNVPIIHPFLSVPSNYVDEPAIWIHPNPASNSITVELPNARSISVEILDVLGKQRFQKNLTNLHELVIPITTLNFGTYFVRVQGVDENGKTFVSSQKLSIQ